MEHQRHDRPRILFLFSDTGGGHRSAAEAIIESIEIEYPDRINCEMVDIFRQYAPPPLQFAPTIYPPLTRMPDIWELGYRMSDGRRRSRFFSNMMWAYIRRSTRKLVKEHPSDLIVSVHQLTNGPVLRSLPSPREPFITVVTDLVSTHAFWYDDRANLIIVPTEAARQRGIKLGVNPDKFRVAGLPVAHRFCQPPGNPSTIRSEIGWPEDKPIVLLVGGGDGMGPLKETAEAIDQTGLPITLVIVTGRNNKIKKRLESRKWNITTKIYGFVHEMPDFMQASDILVTKAGPGTICEAFIAGLPIILYSRLPGQEDGNVSFVVGKGAGVWAPEPEMVVKALTNWVNFPNQRLQVAESSKRLGRPQAARQIARILAEHVGVPAPIQT